MPEHHTAATIEAKPQTRALAERPAEGAGALMKLIERAANDATFDVAKLQALLQVKKEWEADEARKAFIVALTAFKADPPTIFKNKTVSYGEGKSKTQYDHATLDNVCEAVGSALAAHQISHRWEVQQHEGGGISVTCVLTHILGHSERVTLKASPDTSGSKNSIQAIGSTISYLERYSLLGATGLATTDQDDDGEYSEQRDKALRISEDQKQTLINLMVKIIGPDEKQTRRFLDALEIPSIDQLPAPEFDNAVARLNRYAENKKARQQ